MGGIVLAKPDLALFSDVEATRVTIPRLRGISRTRRFDQTLVRFEGDEQPTPFRGEGRPRTYPLVARYFANEHDDLAALLALFELAQDAPDPRMLLRITAGLVPELNAIEVVVVSEITDTFVPGQAVDVSWTASTVAYTIEV